MRWSLCYEIRQEMLLVAYFGPAVVGRCSLIGANGLAIVALPACEFPWERQVRGTYLSTGVLVSDGGSELNTTKVLQITHFQAKVINTETIAHTYKDQKRHTHYMLTTICTVSIANIQYISYEKVQVLVCKHYEYNGLVDFRTGIANVLTKLCNQYI